MTYFELLSKANRLLDKGEITIGQRDEMTKPLWDEIRPKGEWIKHWEHGYVECPFCHEPMTGGNLNFCCKCGADLRGGDKK